jgi:hypothetical protein
VRKLALIVAILALTVLGGTVRAAQANNARQEVVRKLDKVLAQTPLHGLGRIIEREAWRRNVNPYFIVAVSGKESSFGAASCYSNRYNIWGLGACGRAWNPPYFNSWGEAMHYFVDFVRRTWPRASSIYELYGYCDGCMGDWTSSVSSYMHSMFGSEPVLSYH